MSPQMDPAIGYVFALASFMVAATWLIAVGFVGLFMRRKLAAMRRDHGPLPAPEANALLFYALAVLFWPAGFILGAIYLGKPETALQGRNCIAIGLANLSAVVVLTCVGTTVAAFMAPGWFSGL